MAEPPCADISVQRAEPVFATASIVRSWLLVEQPGAWGPDAIRESRFPGPLADALERRADDHGARILLLRRPERARSGPRHAFVSYSGRPSPWVEHRHLDDPEELLDVDFAALGAGLPHAGFGEPWRDPLYLVCTNGRHDPCCARLGRPLLHALLPERPNEIVWESSHVGGDRFAGNLVCFPHGLYFGRLGPDEAVTVVERYERGEIELDYYRGRAGDPYPVQAADYFLRRELALAGIDDVLPLGRRRIEPGLIEVALATSTGETYGVRVRVNTIAEPRPLTCTAATLGRPPSWELAAVMPRGGAGPALH